jgi:hypothetical protein
MARRRRLGARAEHAGNETGQAVDQIGAGHAGLPQSRRMEITMNYGRMAGFLPIAVAVAVLGAACSGDDDPTARVDSAPVDQPATETTEASGDPDDAEDAPEAGSERSTDQEESADDDSGALGSGTGQIPDFDTQAPIALRLDVTSLDRNGDLVELGMTMTNEDEELDFEPTNTLVDPELMASGTRDISGVRLIDQGERKAYLPVIDSEGVCLCTNNLVTVSVPPGDSFELKASFGGIPESVTTLDLDVPGFSTIAGLEVQG